MNGSSNIAVLPGVKHPAPNPVSGTVPNRIANDKLRTRKHLLEAEIASLRQAAKKGRNAHRNQTMLLLAYRHGLRVSELCDLRWSDIDFNAATLHVRRLKQSKDSTHPLTGEELRLLRPLHKAAENVFVFTSERGGPITSAGFRKQLARWGVKAKIGFPVHPHMLRHACGYALANKGMDTRSLQAYLGHASITHTVVYTEMSPNRFNGIWDK